ncbi:diguanylate cyclase [Massilia sp. WF1]|uniref:tetratricopeptide repeat-containing diguanylate cyclase n=1 Tax=unclassified Massilia TaxID=2609279 RepID=UPI00068F3A36|nr:MULTISPECIES: tetratricopeptide repeat-containing diguanylate cyclase [unclassified Massilia]ALK98711.1 diguanylate cyclase [Massilia sp. WG5]KNZ68091.1 diguanylate cyclase [Massilia sp. WF1]
MLAGLYRGSHHRRSLGLLAALFLASGLALADAPPPLAERLAALQDVSRFTPLRALPQLARLEQESRAAPLAEKAAFLDLSCKTHKSLGHLDLAGKLCDELIALGQQHADDTIVARGLLSKAYVLFARNDLAQSHQLVWQAEKLAAGSRDMDLRVRSTISSGESFAEEGNFPMALGKLQAAVTLARQSGQPMLMTIAYNSLAYLYNQMREHEKGFEALTEAYRAAEGIDSPGRLATLKNTEYALSIETGQVQRGRNALLAAVELERKIGAGPMVATSLVNLADCYLKLKDYRNALSYAQQALEQARLLNKESSIATAYTNIGEAYLGLGRIDEGKKKLEEALAWYEKQGDKPSLHDFLSEYGDALERAGDLAGALKAYHRERTLSNELFEKRRQKAVMELQAKYESDARQRQIELLRQENQVKSTEIDNRRLQQRVWWLLAVVFALASVIVYFLYRKVRQANAQLEEKNLELKQQSARDPLTALYNRRHFQEFMRGHQEIAQRGAGAHTGSADETVSALYLMDVDHFKHINDTYGHGAGDAVLREIADALRDILRETDMIVRWGGEEFLAFLPAVPRSSLDDVARRLLNGIPARAVVYQGVTLSVNVSIGFAPFPLAPGGKPMSWERAVNLVDMALYLAKGHGRNRAYGVQGFAHDTSMSMEEIEQDIEAAWRSGSVELSIVQGNWTHPQLQALSA